MFKMSGTIRAKHLILLGTAWAICPVEVNFSKTKQWPLADCVWKQRRTLGLTDIKAECHSDRIHNLTGKAADAPEQRLFTSSFTYLTVLDIASSFELPGDLSAPTNAIGHAIITASKGTDVYPVDVRLVSVGLIGDSLIVWRTSRSWGVCPNYTLAADVVTVVGGVVAANVVAAYIRNRYRSRRNLCLCCGYPCSDMQCPECGSQRRVTSIS